MRPEAELLLKALELFEVYAEHPDAQAKAGAVIGRMYGVGLLIEVEEEVLGRRREKDRERQQRSRDVSRAMSREAVTNGADADSIVVSSSSSTSKKKDLFLSQEALDRAAKVIESRDFEFLKACPDPFRTQWLMDPDWWVSLRDGYPKINAQQQASRYMAWEGARRKRDHRAALRNWVSTADRWREREEMQKAARR